MTPQTPSTADLRALAEIRARHEKAPVRPGWEMWQGQCIACGSVDRPVWWPCDAAALLDRLDKAEAALREIANGPVRQADGAWRQDIAAKALQGERSEYMPALTSTDKEPE